QAARMVRCRGEGAREETHHRGSRRTVPWRGLARERAHRCMRQAGNVYDGGLRPRLDQPAGDRRRNLRLARTAGDDEIEMPRLIANGIDGAARRHPRHPVEPCWDSRREPPPPDPSNPHSSRPPTLVIRRGALVQGGCLQPRETARKYLLREACRALAVETASDLASCAWLALA